MQQQITELHELLKSFRPKVGASVTTEVQQPFQEMINLGSNTGGMKEVLPLEGLRLDDSPHSQTSVVDWKNSLESPGKGILKSGWMIT